MKLDDVSRRIHDQIMHEAGKDMRTDVAPFTSTESGRSVEGNVTSSDAAAPGSVIGTTTLGRARDAVRIVDGRCRCIWGVKGDPHPSCNKHCLKKITVNKFSCVGDGETVLVPTSMYW